MNASRKFALVWRWSLLSSGLIALFWTSWWMTTGHMPVGENSSPRIWDCMLGPIISIITILLVTSKMVQDEAWFLAPLVLVTMIFTGLAAQYIAEPGQGLTAICSGVYDARAFMGLIAGVVVGFILTLLVLMRSGFDLGLISACTIMLGSLIGVGFTSGLFQGIDAGIVAAVASLAAFALYAISEILLAVINPLLSWEFWRKIGNWLIAKDKEEPQTQV